MLGQAAPSAGALLLPACCYFRFLHHLTEFLGARGICHWACEKAGQPWLAPFGYKSSVAPEDYFLLFEELAE